MFSQSRLLGPCTPLNSYQTADQCNTFLGYFHTKINWICSTLYTASTHRRLPLFHPSSFLQEISNIMRQRKSNTCTLDPFFSSLIDTFPPLPPQLPPLTMSVWNHEGELSGFQVSWDYQRVMKRRQTGTASNHQDSNTEGSGPLYLCGLAILGVCCLKSSLPFLYIINHNWLNELGLVFLLDFIFH